MSLCLSDKLEFVGEKMLAAGFFAAGVKSGSRTPSVFAHGFSSPRESSSLEREPFGRLSCNNTERAAEKPVVPVASRDRSGERRTNKQRKSQEMVRPREAHAGSITPLKDYYVGAGGVQRAFAHHVSPVGTSPKAKMMGKR